MLDVVSQHAAEFTTDAGSETATQAAAAPALSISQRTRVTPFHGRVVAAGAKAFTVYNHMLLPTVFESVEADYWHLRENVQLWDVSAERQVALKGPDALRLAQFMTPRDLTKLEVGRCMYAPMTDANGGMVNDPIYLRISDDEVWISIADSDVVLWASALAHGMGLDVAISEPDVFPLAIQGPRSDDLMAKVFGDEIRSIRKFRWAPLPFEGCELVTARSGWSHQGGFEIYLHRPDLAEPLWDALMDAGAEFSVRAGCPNLIERVESGLLSYGNDMTRGDTPLDCGLDRFCAVDGDFDFLGKQALLAIRDSGPRRRVRGLRFGTAPVAPCIQPWSVAVDGATVGHISTAAYSPRFEQNVAIAMIASDYSDLDTAITVTLPDGSELEGRVVDLPMA